MSHAAQMEFIGKIKSAYPEFFTGKRVLEIGSLDINGSLRSFFTNCEYVGIDVAEGPGVDIVCQGQNYEAPAQSFDVVISCEVMEHNPYWAETMRNMVRLCKPSGLVIMTCATLGRHEHGTTRTAPGSSPLTVGLGWNYYRNLKPNDFVKANTWDGVSYMCAVNWDRYDLYFAGFKGQATSAQRAKLASIEQDYKKSNMSWRCIRRSTKATLFNRRNYSPM